MPGSVGGAGRRVRFRTTAVLVAAAAPGGRWAAMEFRRRPPREAAATEGGHDGVRQVPEEARQCDRMKPGESWDQLDRRQRDKLDRDSRNEQEGND